MTTYTYSISQSFANLAPSTAVGNPPSTGGLVAAQLRARKEEEPRKPPRPASS